MKHEWRFINILLGPKGPNAIYNCKKCDREEDIYIDATKALVEFLTADDCKGKESELILEYPGLSFRDNISILRTRSLKAEERMNNIADVLVNFSNRLTNLEND